MSYFVYILQSKKTGRFYTGYTQDLAKRIKDHNRGKTKSLRRHIPLEIIYIEEYTDSVIAHRRELQIKSYKSGQAFKNLINS